MQQLMVHSYRKTSNKHGVSNKCRGSEAHVLINTNTAFIRSFMVLLIVVQWSSALFATSISQ